MMLRMMMRKNSAHCDGSVHKLISMSGLTSNKWYGVILMFCSCPVLKRLSTKKYALISSEKEVPTNIKYVDTTLNKTY